MLSILAGLFHSFSVWTNIAEIAFFSHVFASSLNLSHETNDDIWSILHFLTMIGRAIGLLLFESLMLTSCSIQLTFIIVLFDIFGFSIMLSIFANYEQDDFVCLGNCLIVRILCIRSASFIELVVALLFVYELFDLILVQTKATHLVDTYRHHDSVWDDPNIGLYLMEYDISLSRSRTLTSKKQTLRGGNIGNENARTVALAAGSNYATYDNDGDVSRSDDSNSSDNEEEDTDDDEEQDDDNENNEDEDETIVNNKKSKETGRIRHKSMLELRKKIEKNVKNAAKFVKFVAGRRRRKHMEIITVVIIMLNILVIMVTLNVIVMNMQKYHKYHHIIFLNQHQIHQVIIILIMKMIINSFES